MQMAPDGLLHMKHKTMGYGSIRWENLASKTLVLHRDSAAVDLYFADVDALINAGWAID